MPIPRKQSEYMPTAAVLDQIEARVWAEARAHYLREMLDAAPHLLPPWAAELAMRWELEAMA